MKTLTMLTLLLVSQFGFAGELTLLEAIESGDSKLIAESVCEKPEKIFQKVALTVGAAWAGVQVLAMWVPVNPAVAAMRVASLATPYVPHNVAGYLGAVLQGGFMGFGTGVASTALICG